MAHAMPIRCSGGPSRLCTARTTSAVLRLTRALLSIKSESDDTVSQLRLIAASIATRNTQNADDRLKVYEQFLSGPGRAQFDESIRSRLCWDAALLLRERGDEKGFVEKLKQSIQLDRTNKEAAALVRDVFRPENARRQGQVAGVAGDRDAGRPARSEHPFHDGPRTGLSGGLQGGAPVPHQR